MNHERYFTNNLLNSIKNNTGSFASTSQTQSNSFFANNSGNESIPITFECSHELDKNSLKALHHDDDEDQVYHAISSRSNKQKIKEEPLKSYKNGETCMVCGDAAFGIHYSVWACNGCKTFFRRVVIENRIYSCKKNGDCPINKNMRCSCRHCRFKKCLKVGMDSTELNVERRKKKGAVINSEPTTNIDQVSDPLIRDLVFKERQFLKFLTSTLAPIHSSIEQALKHPSIFKNFDLYEKSQMRPGDQMNFSYWRSKILSAVIEWAKNFNEFMELNLGDREALVVHAAFSNLVLSEAFHTPDRYTDRIVFPDGLSGFRNLSVNILKERSGLIPTVVGVINNILVPIRRMRINEIEYVLLQAIILFDPECISLSEHAVEIVLKKRESLLRSMQNYTELTISNKSEASYRFAALLLRISNVHKVAAFKRETLCTIETFNLMNPHPLSMELSKKYPDTSFF